MISRILSIPLALLLATSGLQAQYSEVVSFGDSLTDSGNNAPDQVALGLDEPHSAWTNNADDSGQGIGGTWLEQLAVRLGQPVTPSSSSGTNYAVAGATTGEMFNQLGLYGFEVSGVASATALYTHLGGANDIGTPPDDPTAITLGQTAANNIKDQIEAIIVAGGEHFLWVSLPPLGSGTRALAGETFNAQMETNVAYLRSTYPEANIHTMDFYALNTVLAAYPALYGFTNTTDAWLYSPSTEPYSRQADPADSDKFAIWDGTHPTTALHRWMANSAEAAVNGELTSGSYRIVNRNSGLVLDVSGGGTANGTLIAQWGWNDGDNQIWHVVKHVDDDDDSYMIIGKQSGKPLDVIGASTADGTNIELWDWNDGDNQKWIITRHQDQAGVYHTIEGVQSGKLIEVNGQSTAPGAGVNIWPNNNGLNQQWVFEPVY